MSVVEGAIGVADVAARAAAAPRDGVLDVDHAWLGQRARDWDDLAGRTASPAPFYSRHVVDAHVRRRITPAPRFVTAWRAGALVGLWPYRPARLGWGASARTAWVSPFVTSSLPLVARDGTADAVRLLLDGVAQLGGRWRLPRFGLDDDVGAALLREIDRRGWPSAVLDRFDRPVLERQVTYDAFLAGLSSGRRKDLRRRRRRLAEIGDVSARSHTHSAGLQQAVEVFLTLEAAGWKGKRGTAFASRPDTAAFARTLFCCDHGPVTGRADLLLLDARPIAASLALVSGRTAYLLKTTYDESLSRFGPGVLLEDEIIRAMHETGFADRLDSASEPGTPLDSLYGARAAVGDVIFACSGAAASGFGLLSKAEQLRRRIKQHVKIAVSRLRSTDR